MERVATSTKTSNHQTYLRNLEVKKANIQSKIAGEEKYLSLDENPSASGLASKYRSDLTRLDGYKSNISRIQVENQLVHGQLQELSTAMARAKELTVQAANGTYTSDDLKHAAGEMNQLIHFMVDLGNLTDENGNAMFSGTEKSSKAFEGFMGRVAGADTPMLTQVKYIGNSQANEVSIDQGKSVDVERAGSRLFWGGAETLHGANVASGYRVLADATVYVNGQEIQLRAGDSVNAIVARINGTTVAVTADVDMENRMVISGNRSEQIYLADGPNSTVFRDLGLIQEGMQPPYNISPYAQKEGDNIFNQLINVRNMMLRGDVEAIGSRGIKEVEVAHNSVVNSLAMISSQTSRLDAMASALSYRELNINEANQQESVLTDMDRTEMMLEYKRLDNVHTATLQSASRALKPSLLDFLR